MDDDETIPRREAIAGLSLLGALTLALVGTIAFRIIHAAPRRGNPSPAANWASSQPAVELESTPMAPVAPIAPTTEQLFTEDADPPAESIPVIANDSGGVPAVSTTGATASDTQSPPPASERPRFVAPGIRQP
jgi:hypothetical protein